MDYHRLRYAARLLQLAADERRQASMAQRNVAAAHAEAGMLDRAEAAYKSVLAQNANHADWWRELALVHSKQQRFDDAAVALLQSLKLDPTAAESHYELGTVLEHLGEPSGDLREHLDALSVGRLRMVQHRIPEAVAACEAEYQQHPDSLVHARTLASALGLAGEPGRAALVLGLAYASRKAHSKTIRELTKALHLGAQDASAYVALGDALNRTRRYADAIDVCTSGLKLFRMEAGIYRELVWALGESNQTEEAIAAAENAARTLGNPLFLAAKRQLALPIVYESTEQVHVWRTRFTDGLHRLAPTLAPEDIHPNFYLGYQGLNDMPLQREHGAIIERILRARYPEWTRPLAMPQVGANGRIRVGYIFAGHTGIDPLFIAWITGHDPARFEILCFQIGGMVDPSSHHITAAAAAFHHLPEDLEVISRRVVEEQLHVLVYLYIGMGALWSQLAGLRLAPIQCATWGHPMTTGLPTIDCFISNELMEPDDAETHYSEALVQLPGIGTCPAAPFLPPLVKTRADFGLPDDAIVYISPQSPAKYLPQYDAVFPAIAARVPHAIIVLMEPGVPEITHVLRRRLQEAFAQAGLDSERFVRFVPNQEYEAYLDLLRRSDVFLDTFSWSGGLTTIDAIRCALPVVTHPGAMMRGRQSTGLLMQMGVVDTIAASVGDYVEIAVKLGLDSEWRRSISEALRARQDRVFDDWSWLPALEDFYRRVVEKTATTTD